MSKTNKVPKTKDEIEENFRQVFGYLERSGRAYDEGYVDEAPRLASAIYVLCHDRGKKTQSILSMVGRKNQIEFLDTARPLDPANLLSEFPLALMQMSPSETKYVPMLDQGPPENYQRPAKKFNKWWEAEVLRDFERRTVSRRQLIFHMRHREGGAHASPDLDEFFADLARNNSMAWVTLHGNEQFTPKLGPHYASVRQVAFELEQTLKFSCGDLLT